MNRLTRYACGAALGALALTAVSASGAGLPQAGEPVTLDPSEFRATITHPYLPLAPGRRWVYAEQTADGGAARVVVTVTGRHKTILGIRATVVRDVVTEGGELVEDTIDYYAQDRAGNVWYLGEVVKNYEKGRYRDAKGSWLAGVAGAQPGIAMPAKPRVGMTYRQEYLARKAEDRGRVLSVSARATVPVGSFKGLVQTEDTTPLEPGVVEHKYYAKGVGQVLSIHVKDGAREELVSRR